MKIAYEKNPMLLYTRFFICWCSLYTSEIAIDRLIRHSHDLASGHLLLPKDPGDTDPYLAGGIILTVIGIIAGVILALVYTTAFILMDAVPLRKHWSPLLKSVLISAMLGTVLGILIYRVWSGYTHDILFSYTASGVALVSAVTSGWLAAHQHQHVLQGR